MKLKLDFCFIKKNKFFFSKLVEKYICLNLKYIIIWLIDYRIGKIHFLIMLDLKFAPPVIGPIIVLGGRSKKVKEFQSGK